MVASQIDVRLSILGWPLKNIARPKNFNPAVDVAAKIEDFIVNGDVSVTFSNKGKLNLTVNDVSCKKMKMLRQLS